MGGCPKGWWMPEGWVDVPQRSGSKLLLVDPPEVLGGGSAPCSGPNDLFVVPSGHDCGEPPGGVSWELAGTRTLFQPPFLRLLPVNRAQLHLRHHHHPAELSCLPKTGATRPFPSQQSLASLLRALRDTLEKAIRVLQSRTMTEAVKHAEHTSCISTSILCVSSCMINVGIFSPRGHGKACSREAAALVLTTCQTKECWARPAPCPAPLGCCRTLHWGQRRFPQQIWSAREQECGREQLCKISPAFPAPEPGPCRQLFLEMQTGPSSGEAAARSGRRARAEDAQHC